LTPDFSLPRRTGIAVTDIAGLGDTRTMDYDIPATSVPTEDTES
jgi:hypothetical protein